MEWHKTVFLAGNIVDDEENIEDYWSWQWPKDIAEKNHYI